jgi:hypothetical protein
VTYGYLTPSVVVVVVVEEEEEEEEEEEISLGVSRLVVSFCILLSDWFFYL